MLNAPGEVQPDRLIFLSPETHPLTPTDVVRLLQQGRVVLFTPPSPSSAPAVLSTLRALCRQHGLPDVARTPEGLLPASLSANDRGLFQAGIGAAVLEVYRTLCSSPEGRKAIADLGFQPLFHKDGG